MLIAMIQNILKECLKLNDDNLMEIMEMKKEL